LLAVSKPRALEAIKYVAAKKKRREMPNSKRFDKLPTLQLWDRDAYFPSRAPSPVIEIRDLTVGLAIAAFSRFLQHVYGMHFEAADVCAGEVWHPDVRKVNVRDENGEVVGWIYFDLFNRAGKPGGACHYTVRCSRRVDLDDTEGISEPVNRGRLRLKLRTSLCFLLRLINQRRGKACTNDLLQS
jgi:intermediate peptidase